MDKTPKFALSDAAGEPLGFSLVEVILAAGLVSFLLVGTAELLVQSVSVQRKADEWIRVTGLLSSEVDKLRTLPFDAAELSAGVHEAEVEFPTGGEPAALRWRVEDDGPASKKVDFSLTRNGRPGRSLEADLILSRDLGF